MIFILPQNKTSHLSLTQSNSEAHILKSLMSRMKDTFGMWQRWMDGTTLEAPWHGAMRECHG